MVVWQHLRQERGNPVTVGDLGQVREEDRRYSSLLPFVGDHERDLRLVLIHTHIRGVGHQHRRIPGDRHEAEPVRVVHVERPPGRPLEARGAKEPKADRVRGQPLEKTPAPPRGPPRESDAHAPSFHLARRCPPPARADTSARSPETHSRPPTIDSLYRDRIGGCYGFATALGPDIAPLPANRRPVSLPDGWYSLTDGSGSGSHTTSGTAPAERRRSPSTLKERQAQVRQVGFRSWSVSDVRLQQRRGLRSWLALVARSNDHKEADG